MRADVRRERDAIAALRAEWATLENPARIQGLVRRHLPLRPAEATQYDTLDQLPERAAEIVQPAPEDMTATMLENPDDASTTSSIPDQITQQVAPR
jgi:hypothetical protein